jgi:hypothetical protein
MGCRADDDDDDDTGLLLCVQTRKTGSLKLKTLSHFLRNHA